MARACVEYPYSILTSVAFFVVCLLLYWRTQLGRADFGIAVMAQSSGMAEFYLLAEPGKRMLHSNFGWGMRQALSLLLFATLRFVITQPSDMGFRLSALAGLLHVASGLLFMINLVLTGDITF